MHRIIVSELAVEVGNPLNSTEVEALLAHDFLMAGGEGADDAAIAIGFKSADNSHFPDEVGLDAAISTTKGCYVGQEIVARTRTYGRVNRRLVGFRFPDGPLDAGTLLKRPDESEPGKIERGRVTSAVVSPVFGAIGLGYAFRDVPAGARLISAAGAPRGAVVSSLPFSL